MILGLQFHTFLGIVITLAVVAQIYLFLRIRKAIRSSLRQDRFKLPIIALVGAIIVLLFAANLYIMFKPIPWVDPPPEAQLLLFYPPAVWGLGSILSALILGLVQLTGWLGSMVVRRCRALITQPSSLPMNPERRRFLKAGVGGLATAPFLLFGYGAAYAGRTSDVEELTLPFGRSLRVVQLTDIHAGIYMTRKEMRRYTDQINALQPDLFVLTGDFISNSIAFLPGCLEEMVRVRPRFGTFATLGNHEHWYGKMSDIQALFRQYRIPLLLNTHQIIRTEQGAFAVAGIDDLRAGFPDLEATLRGVDATIPTLLLSHRPEIFPQAAAYGIPLTLAGHYHGGQIKLRLSGGAISLAHLRTPYPEGLYRINASHLYVNRGIGTTFSPVRLNAPPEVTLLHLT
jgi:predicted MPP superfamily phosphohydrolase